MKIIGWMLAISLFAPAAMAKEKPQIPVFGLERIGWKMSIADVKRDFPEIRQTKSDDSETKLYAISNYPPFSCHFALLFEFYRGGLNSIGLLAEKNVSDCKDRIKAELIRSYGPTDQSYVADLGIKNLDWRGPVSTIRYQENSGWMPRFEQTHLSVSFWRTGGYFRPIP